MAEPDRTWIAEGAREIAIRAERELEALVGVSSPSGDVTGSEEAAAIVTALLPADATVERPECSSPAHAPDLVARLPGSGRGRLLLLGHLDTVISHSEHRPLERVGDRLVGTGTVDMKGGVVLALGVLNRLADVRHLFAETSLLLVMDEEWRTHDFVHTRRFEGYDGCLCFEAGERGRDGGEGVVVRRKAAAALRIRATGAASHSGTAPDAGRNALLALATAAQRVAETHNPTGADRLTAVPTVLHSGDAFNVVPANGHLDCDLRADRLDAVDRVVDAIPEEVDGATLALNLIRRWPAMDTRAATAGLLTEAEARLGRPIVGVERGGASDASHLATRVPLTLDGLGPRGGGAHAPDEFVLRETLGSRAEVALAVSAGLLERAG